MPYLRTWSVGPEKVVRREPPRDPKDFERKISKSENFNAASSKILKQIFSLLLVEPQTEYASSVLRRGLRQQNVSLTQFI